jgi:hypothetical protein
MLAVLPYSTIAESMRTDPAEYFCEVLVFFDVGECFDLCFRVLCRFVDLVSLFLEHLILNESKFYHFVYD